MYKRQQPDGLTFDFVNEAVVFVDHEFACSSDFAVVSQHWKLGKTRSGFAKQFIHSHGGQGIIGNDVLPHVVAVFLGLRSPDNFHIRLTASLRRLANLASTWSLERPLLARIETRAAATLPRR